MPLPIFGGCPPLKPRTDCVRQDGSYLVDAWLEEIVYAHDVTVTRLHFAADASEARSATFKRRDANHVFVAHPQREMARRLTRDFVVGFRRTSQSFGSDDAFDAPEIALCIADVLICDRAHGAEKHELHDSQGQRRDSVNEHPRQCGIGGWKVGVPLISAEHFGARPCGVLVRSIERGKAYVDAFAGGTNRALAGVAGEWKGAAPRERAEQDRTDRGTMLRAHRLHVE